MGYVKKLVYLTEEQKNTLFANGSITVGGKTITYDPNDVYVTPRDLPDFQVGTVETLPAGSQATASITGTGDTPVINLGIPKGDQGIQGPQGVKGDTGAKGDKGDKGDQGDQGPQGVKGDTGAKGDKGDKGDTGNTGPVGLTPDLTIGTVQTLPAGSSATASITGTAEDPVLNLGIPKGDQGEVSQAEFDALSDTVDDMQDTLEHKADIDGYYSDMTVGAAEQVVSSTMVEDNAPYKHRTSGGSTDIGNRAYVDKIVGGTVAWNQQVRDAASENQTDYADVVTVTDAVEDAAEVRVKLEPVQDLHGYDHPWPAGGGVNLADVATVTNVHGLTVNVATDGVITINGTATAASYIQGAFNCPDATAQYTWALFNAALSSGVEVSVRASTDASAGGWGVLNSANKTITFTPSAEPAKWQIYVANGTALSNFVVKPMIVLGETTPASFSPYSNICPISGWDEVNVTRTGKNLWNKDDPTAVIGYYNLDGTFSPISTWRAIAFSCQQGFTYTKSGDGWGGIVTFWYDNTLVSSTNASTVTVPSGVNNVRFACQYSSTNAQLELGSTATDYAPYQANTYTIQIPTEAGTVYGGELTVNKDGSGSMVVDRENIASYNGETLPSTWISDRDVYAAGTTPTIGAQVVYKLASPITYTLTTTQVRTLLGTNNVWSDAGQLSLTYTGTDEHLVLTSGRKFLTRINGTDSMVLGAGQEVTAVKGRDNVFDLTQMLGTSVADYVYQQGASYFRKWFGGTRYAYNAGELISVEGLQSRDVVGFNQWDEQWENGLYNNTTGEPIDSTSMIRSKNAIRVFPNTQYYMDVPYSSTVTGFAVVLYYDANGNYTGNVFSLSSNGQGFLTPSKACYVKFYVSASYGTTYNHDICINISHNASRNGSYEPYTHRSYPLDSTLTLRGIPKVGTDGVYWDGDEYGYDGAVKRRYGVVDLGTLTWNYDVSHAVFYANILDKDHSTMECDVMCKEYKQHPDNGQNVAVGLVMDDKSITGFYYPTSQNSWVYIKDTLYTASAALKASLQGVKCIYQLATSTTETAQPYQHIQSVDDWGTEEFVSGTITPVGHESRYPQNLRDKLQHLPALASSNGSYIITQTDGQMVLSPFPAPPTAAGNYLLKATVSGGNATYSWVAQ